MDKKVYEFISQQNNDPIVERKICAVSGTEFAVFQSDVDFYNKISPTFDGAKFPIPTPTLCPEERQRRRLAQRNERNYFKTQCAISGKPIVSVYNPEIVDNILDGKMRWSDNRDATDYAQDINFSLSVFTQFSELRKKVPKIAMMNDNGV